MERARRHQRLLACLAFGLLALVAELAGRSLIQRLDFGRHVSPPRYANADYYPFLLVAVKAGVALLLARLAWRFAKARASALAARRVLAALGSRPARSAPRMRLELSPRLALSFFAVTSAFYLVQTDSEAVASARWSLLAPGMHTSALPVFAVLAVVVAVVYGAVARWLSDYESYAEAAVAHARRLATRPADPSPRRSDANESSPPRRLFGLAFEVRPPPVAA